MCELHPPKLHKELPVFTTLRHACLSARWAQQALPLVLDGHLSAMTATLIPSVATTALPPPLAQNITACWTSVSMQICATSSPHKRDWHARTTFHNSEVKHRIGGHCEFWFCAENHTAGELLLGYLQHFFTTWREYILICAVRNHSQVVWSELATRITWSEQVENGHFLRA